MISRGSNGLMMLCGLTLILTEGCSVDRAAVGQLEVGQTKDEVMAALGEPDGIMEFELPDQPFFGPQEALTSSLDPGTPVEEWHYTSRTEVTYVWFAGRSAEAQDLWTVVGTATYPADVVF